MTRLRSLLLINADRLNAPNQILRPKRPGALLQVYPTTDRERDGRRTSTPRRSGVSGRPRIVRKGRGQGRDVHREQIAAAATRAEGRDVLLISLPVGFQEALAVALEQDCKVGAVATVSEGVVWATSTEPALAIVDTMAERDGERLLKTHRKGD